MMRRHLQFILKGSIASQIEVQRRRWDPVMAARTPAHISLAYPEECMDEVLLLERTALAARCTRPFRVTLEEASGEEGGRGGVWYPVADASNIWNTLRASILAPPFQKRAVAPHVTIVHPRTSKRGPQALAALPGARVA